MRAMTGEWWAGVAGLLFCSVIYAWNYWCRDLISNWLTTHTNLQRDLPWRSAQLILRIPLYGVPGILGYAVLWFIRPDIPVPAHFNLWTVPEGLALGGGLMVAGAALANGAFVTMYAFRPKDRRPRDANTELLIAKDSGWIRGYTLAYRSLPLPVFLAITVISITGEELAFRGVLLPLLVRGFGAVVGSVLTVLAFMGIQKPFMPSWYGAIVPMSGALVVGVVLGYLALVDQDMFLLIMSHFSFFIVTILLVETPPTVP